MPWVQLVCENWDRGCFSGPVLGHQGVSGKGPVPPPGTSSDSQALIVGRPHLSHQLSPCRESHRSRRGGGLRFSRLFGCRSSELRSTELHGGGGNAEVQRSGPRGVYLDTRVLVVAEPVPRGLARGSPPRSSWPGWWEAPAWELAHPVDRPWVRGAVTSGHAVAGRELGPHAG